MATFEKAYEDIIRITGKNFKSNKAKVGGKRDRITFRNIAEFDIAVLDLSRSSLMAEGLTSFQTKLILEFISSNSNLPEVRALISSEAGGSSKAGFKTVSSRISKVVKLINASREQEFGWDSAGGGDLEIHTAHQRGSSASLSGKIQTFSNLGTGMFTTRSGNTTAGTKRKFVNQTKKQKEVKSINNKFLTSNKDAIARKVAAEMEKAIYEIEGQGIVIEDFVKELIDSNATGRPLQTVTFGSAAFNIKLGNIVEKPLNAALNKVLASYANTLAENLADKLGKEVSELRASPSLEEKVAIGLTNILADKKTKMAGKTKKKIGSKVKKRKVKVKTNTKVLAAFKGVSASNKKKKKGQVDAQMSPLALRSLLQRAIAEAVQKNMGKGRARKVLNYRSGRFADSVNIDNVVPRRDGAMVAFYSYMKNPYSTFAEGGAQYPNGPSRDPNLLIRKSMRQLAAAAAVTRFFPMES